MPSRSSSTHFNPYGPYHPNASTSSSSILHVQQNPNTTSNIKSTPNARASPPPTTTPGYAVDGPYLNEKGSEYQLSYHDITSHNNLNNNNNSYNDYDNGTGNDRYGMDDTWGWTGRNSPIQLRDSGGTSHAPYRLGGTGGGCKEDGGGKLGKALIFGWVITTVMFVVATAFYKGELFSALDDLSKTLRSMSYTGQSIFAFLIFLTTIPPLPLYSTLMVLSGYTFGATNGFVISYLASLIGALIVFVVARTFLKDCITKCLSSSPTSMSLLNIIPSKPHLLLLIRIAPYPYNLLNVILASSPTLTLKTYMGCTALSLFKVILHTWFGSGIHDISELHRSRHNSNGPGFNPGMEGDLDGSGQGQDGFGGGREGGGGTTRDDLKMYWTWTGLALCVILFVYLHRVAKKALEKAQAEAERENRAEEGQLMVLVGGGGGVSDGRL